MSCGLGAVAMGNIKLAVTNFKCFGGEPQGFEAIKPINILIGRNNSGKSSLIDVISSTVANNFDVPEHLWHGHSRPDFLLSTELTEEHIKSVFLANTSGGGIPGNSHYEFGMRLIGLPITVKLNQQVPHRVVSFGDAPDYKTPLDKLGNRRDLIGRLSSQIQNPLAGKQFRRLHAERNIVPEPDNPNDMGVRGDGHGATNIIQSFINKAALSSELVERDLLNDLNHIFGSDASFSDIVCQQLPDNLWEIYLEEDAKGRVPLSHSGSGLKTIILVLIYFHLLPVVAKKPLSSFIFAFEELENNLHPSLLRRLLAYLRDKATKHDCPIFITTHSNVAIDVFSRDEEAQIIHVSHTGSESTCRTVRTYIDNKGILDDLDVRASDLLQANGIIWVEGPSDRIYLNRWIELWSDGQLSEGVHYQCVFYGGRLLSHLSSDDPQVVSQSVAILRVNRNSALLIDSDKRNRQARLNATKCRVRDELHKVGGIPWITNGKEIENYLSKDVVSCWLAARGMAKAVDPVGQYDDFFTYLDEAKAGLGKQMRDRKPLLAEQLTPLMTRANMLALDLGERLDNLCREIRRWNGLE